MDRLEDLMTPPRILVKTSEASRGGFEPAPETGWYLLSGIGLVFAVVAGADLVLAWYPLRFGTADWEFGTVTTVLNGMPLFAMGLGLAFAGAVARGRDGLTKFWSAVMILVALVLLGCLVLYAKNIPAALASLGGQDMSENIKAQMRLGMNKAILKGLVQGVSYPVAFLWTGWLGWKHATSA